MDTQTAHFLLTHVGVDIHFLIGCRIEGHALVTEYEGQRLVVGIGIDL